MALNHLVLPLYQPPAEGNIYRWLKWTRRALIVAIIMAGLLLPAAGRRAGPGQPRHRRLRRHLAVPARRAVGAVLADRQPPRLYRRPAGGDSGVDGDHAAAAGRQPAGFLHSAAEHDLRAGRHQLAHGGDRLAGGQRADVHPDLAVHQRQPEEASAAEACAVDNVRRPQRRELHAASPQEFATQLAKPLGAKAAQKEVEQALRDLYLPFDERRPTPCAACATASKPTSPA
jgi:hypothetical protein